MMANPPLHWLGFSQIRALYAAGQLTPTQLVEHLLDRIDRHESSVHAFTYIDRAQLLADAGVADKRLAARSDLPLLGLPVAVKDVIDVQGMPTSFHSRFGSPTPRPQDALCIARLRAAGALIMGKLSAHEFSVGGPALDLPFPSARNPWDVTRHPGGSSSGASAGLAAGFFPAAIGTDTGGSVRGPADTCGVLGLKPTQDSIPLHDIEPLSYTLDNVGPMAREPEDLALLLVVMAGRSAQLRPSKELQGLRIGYVRRFHCVDYQADPRIAAALDATAQGLASLGATIEIVDLPTLREFASVNAIVASVESWSSHAEKLTTQPERYCSRSRRRLLIGAFLEGRDYIEAQRRRNHLSQVVSERLRDVDALLVASSMHLPCAIADDKAIDATYPFEARSPFSATGHPAVNFPIGLSDEGVPMGAQLVGRHHDEAGILGILSTYLAHARPLGERRPPLERTTA